MKPIDFNAMPGRSKGQDYRRKFIYDMTKGKKRNSPTGMAVQKANETYKPQFAKQYGADKINQPNIVNKRVNAVYENWRKFL
jgi:threonyl-tRNA synthetase